jgi:hypothetical protein
MSWRVNNQQAWDFYGAFHCGKQWAYELFDSFSWEEACANMLCHSACFSGLDACFADFVQ